MPDSSMPAEEKAIASVNMSSMALRRRPCVCVQNYSHSKLIHRSRQTIRIGESSKGTRAFLSLLSFGRIFLLFRFISFSIAYPNAACDCSNAQSLHESFLVQQVQRWTVRSPSWLKALQSAHLVQAVGSMSRPHVHWGFI